MKRPNICSRRRERARRRGPGGVPFALDTAARIAALQRSGAFQDIEHHVSRWELTLTTDQAVALYGTYSNIVARPDRAEVLLELRRIAATRFAGRVVRNMSTALYLARRRARPEGRAR